MTGMRGGLDEDRRLGKEAATVAGMCLPRTLMQTWTSTSKRCAPPNSKWSSLFNARQLFQAILQAIKMYDYGRVTLLIRLHLPLSADSQADHRCTQLPIMWAWICATCSPAAFAEHKQTLLILGDSALCSC